MYSDIRWPFDTLFSSGILAERRIVRKEGNHLEPLAFVELHTKSGIHHSLLESISITSLGATDRSTPRGFIISRSLLVRGMNCCRSYADHDLLNEKIIAGWAGIFRNVKVHMNAHSRLERHSVRASGCSCSFSRISVVMEVPCRLTSSSRIVQQHSIAIDSCAFVTITTTLNSSILKL